MEISTIIPILCLALLTALGAALVIHLRRAGKLGTLDDLQLIANIKDMLIAAAPEIVASMEAKWGRGSGPVKLAGAIFELLRIIPAQYIAEFNGAVLVDIVEDALAATRGVWEANPGMLGEEKQPQPVIGFEIPNGYDEYSSEEE